MSSVSLDIFSMPTETYNNEEFDCMLVCVDRLSGWIIAKPTTKLGLTAKKAATLLLENGWDIFGIPTTITSDQGPQFVGQWFKTMCSRLGIRQAFSQAYHPRANGRAERAGQSLIELLKKLNTHQKINWVEALPRVLYRYHDVINETGHSPYQILFGRPRLGLGIPHQEWDLPSFGPKT